MTTPPAAVSPLPKRLTPAFPRTATASSSTSHVSLSPSKVGTLSVPNDRPLSVASTSTGILQDGSLNGSRAPSIVELNDDVDDPGLTQPSSPLRSKGKERDNGVGVEGELTITGDARKGLRALAKLGAASGSRSRAGSFLGEHDTLPTTGTGVTPYSQRRYYVLTNAGKPVFTSHNEEDDEVDTTTNLMGVIQALMSIFAQDGGDRLRSYRAGRHQFVFLVRPPLYLFCVSDWGEPEHIIKVHLEYIHLQILSVITSTQLAKAFQRRSNFDLRRLLEGTEPFLRQLIRTAQEDFSFLTSTLQPLRMPPALRDAAASALAPPAKFRDLLYVLLVAGGKIVTLLRPRKHSIHPSDLHLLLNTLASSETLRTTESWIPICLPKFNPAGFVHAYVSFVRAEIGLVFVSADREAFEGLRTWKDGVVEKLDQDRTLARIEQAIASHPYSVSAVGVPGLRHFLYKSRQNVQITMPSWEGAYAIDTGVDRKRLITTYHRLHDAIHAKSSQPTSLKLIYVRSEHEACLAWLTKPFELYLAMSPHLTKSAVVNAANTVARWIGCEESKVFLKEAPVF